MRIGFDIDGVLTDIEQWQLDCGSRFCFETKHSTIVNYREYDFTKIFDVSMEDAQKFLNDYFYDYARSEPARKFASEVIGRLREEGNEIYIITARSSGTFYENDEARKKMQALVKNWLAQNKIYYDHLIFSSEDKVNTCLKNKIDIMVEDKVENIDHIAKYIPVICFHANYNEKCSGDHIYRAYSFWDVYTKIQEIKR